MIIMLRVSRHRPGMMITCSACACRLSVPVRCQHAREGLCSLGRMILNVCRVLGSGVCLLYVAVSTALLGV